MATKEETPSFDDLDPIDESNDEYDDDAPLVKLDAGESIVGEIREVHHNLGEHDSTLLYVARGLGDVCKMWSNGQINRKLDAAGLGVGDLIGIKKTEETETYTDESGEEQEYHIFDVRSLNSPDGGE